MYDAFEDRKRYAIVTEICSGGELFDELDKRLTQKGAFSERETAVVINALLSVITFCHDHNIVHR